jgi:hypothetical protein
MSVAGSIRQRLAGRLMSQMDTHLEGQTDFLTRYRLHYRIIPNPVVDLRYALEEGYIEEAVRRKGG